MHRRENTHFSPEENTEKTEKNLRHIQRIDNSVLSGVALDPDANLDAWSSNTSVQAHKWRRCAEWAPTWKHRKLAGYHHAMMSDETPSTEAPHSAASDGGE